MVGRLSPAVQAAQRAERAAGEIINLAATLPAGDRRRVAAEGLVAVLLGDARAEAAAGRAAKASALAGCMEDLLSGLPARLAEMDPGRFSQLTIGGGYAG